MSRGKTLFAFGLVIGIGFLVWCFRHSKSTASGDTQNSSAVVEAASTKATIGSKSKLPSNRPFGFGSPGNDPRDPATISDPTSTPASVPVSAPALKKKPISRERLELIREPDEVKNLLLDAQRENFSDWLNLTRPSVSSDEAMRQLNGGFDGTLTLLDLSTFDVTSRSVVTEANNQLVGEVRMSVLKDGAVVDHFEHRGLLNFYRSSENGAGIVINVTAEKYLELFYLSSLDSFVGNYYQKTSGRFALAGSLQLDRVSR